MLRTVHLYGKLGKKFGKKHRFDVSSPIEAVRALMVVFKRQDFRNELREGFYRIVAGDKKTGMDFSEEEVNFHLGEKQKDIHIIPVAAGAKKGIGKILGGLALIALVAFTGGFGAAHLATATGVFGITYGQVALLGVGLALSGIAESKVPGTPSLAPIEPVDRRQSFLFNGVENVTDQGNAIPLVYGNVITGSVRVSVGLDSEFVNFE